ncbi:HAD family hydrolase [Allokutzneria sp. A3M-2-11 16]|uniref:HAD family hydrolase n=1 Tax=Allokutzneria sp. A3M-2-11 16 TaxID=2962043 RepID=UPI0020B8A7EB|nr:HAD family hydrolase [Allokutzneria sp. A3M-2-11 16]MCP3799651.1 HAD family hydrolase [Allokutzneria sp. A3M-2-11 16]
MTTPRLIASDADGTLLTPLERVSDRTAAVVRRAIDAGAVFVVATGRPPRWTRPILDQLGLRGPAVCNNGSMVYDFAEERVLSQAALDPILLRDAAKAVTRAIPGSTLAVERAEGADTDCFLVEEGYVHAWANTEAVLVPRDELLGKPAVKLLVRNALLTSDEMATAAKAVLDGAVDVTFSIGSGLIELVVSGVSKATGLELLADRFGLTAADVVAFGDMPNDIAMLGWAGIGVAMGNAHPSALEAADEVTAPNSEDGVAQVLERWF